MARAGLIAALLLGAAPAGAQSAAQRRELGRVQRELQKTLAELEELRSEEKELGGAVSRLESRDAQSRRRLDELQARLRQAESRRADLKGRLDAAKKVSGFWSAALATEAARHAASAASRPEASGSSGLWAEEYRRAALLEKARHLRGLRGFRDETEQAEAEARRKAVEISESRSKTDKEREARRREYEEKKAALAQTQERVAAAARRAKELEESARAMTALLERAARKARYRRPAGGGPAPALDAPRHSLPWPAPGTVARGFGRERDPELGTWTVHQGVLLDTAPEAPVRSVAPGKVIFAGPFRSYGQVVIVDHGAGFFSVYGGLGAMEKDKGATVRKGETLARAGAGPSGGRLYLELRRGTDALDPVDWLERR
ncbi:MAG: peptidoglycan DD-metalloendopeptidase family protein [Elusimicrobiota bacterium]|nr:peptidoglycan DD-metalloendopeptidase family protein [Elusimicrobiota bacterium]